MLGDGVLDTGCVDRLEAFFVVCVLHNDSVKSEGKDGLGKSSGESRFHNPAWHGSDILVVGVVGSDSDKGSTGDESYLGLVHDGILDVIFQNEDHLQK